MGWIYGLTDLTGVPIGRLHWATERKLSLPLSGLTTATVRLRMDDPMATEIVDRDGDVLLKIYRNPTDTTPTFIGDLTTAEEVGDESHSIACNFAGPLWRLQKRLFNKTATGIDTLNGERGQIAWALIEAANTLDWDTGIREGTIGTTVNTTAGPWRYKPIAEAEAEMAAARIYPPDPTYLAKDDFIDTAMAAPGFSGPLCNTTRPATIGGLWTGAGDADDFYGGSGTDSILRRTASDVGVENGRYAVLADVDVAGVTVQVDISTVEPYTGRLGVVARYQDTTHWVRATLDPEATPFVRIHMCNGGAPTLLGEVDASGWTITADWAFTIRLQVDAAGAYKVWFINQTGDIGVPVLSGTNAALATAGALESGAVGIYDMAPGATVRKLDNFFAQRAMLAWDEFGFGPGALTGRLNSMGTGANWTALAGSDADDFFGEAAVVVGGGGARRENFGDGNFDTNLDTGRYVTLGGSVSGAISVHAGIYMSTPSYTGRLGVIARCTDINNWVMAAFESLSTNAAFSTPTPAITLRKRVGGTITTLGAVQVPAARPDYSYAIRLQIDATGTYAVWFAPEGDDPAAPVIEGQDATLVGGSGAVGIYDSYITNDISLRVLDHFTAWTPLQTMAYQGLDFEFEPVEPVVDNFYRTGDVKICEFNASTAIGTEKPEVIFEYGGGNRSAKSYRRAISREGLVNSAFTLPSGFPEDTDVKSAVDLASKTARGLFEEVIPSDIGDASLRQSLVSAHARVRGVPRHIITFEPSATAPVFGTDYIVGDSVTARAIVNGSVRINGLVRVYRVDIAIDDEGKAEVSPVLTYE